MFDGIFLYCFLKIYFYFCLQQITALKKENFNLKLRIYFMEERMQQKCDDSTEDIFKTVLHFIYLAFASFLKYMFLVNLMKLNETTI